MCFLITIVLSILACFIGLIVFVVCGKEKDVFQNISELAWFKLGIKFVYKLLKYRKQGRLYLDKSLVYIADTNTDFTLALSVRNHKITVIGLR